MRRSLSVALAVASLSLASAANAAVSTTGPDTGPDNSFTIGFSGSNVAQPTFSEAFNFSSSVAGFLSAVISTTGGGANSVNDVDFTRVFLSGPGITGSQGDLLPIAGSNDVNEFRALNELAVNAGSFSLTTQGTSSGLNGSYGGSVSFRAASAVPEASTWAMMLVGFGAMGVSMRRRNGTSRLVQAA